MARKYTLNRSSSTGWWVWECKDGSGGGSEPTRSEAREAAKGGCISGVVVTPPDVDVVIYRGYIASFSVNDLDGRKNTFSTAEISQAEFAFFFGLSEGGKVEDAKKLITILKIWGLYRGGQDVKTIAKLHDMSAEVVKTLISRRYWGATIIVEDDGKIIWRR